MTQSNPDVVLQYFQNFISPTENYIQDSLNSDCPSSSPVTFLIIVRMPLEDQKRQNGYNGSELGPKVTKEEERSQFQT